MPKRKDTATFVAQARAIHGDRYDYSRVEYVACRKRVKIICPVHGEFQQTPDLHRKGRNCRKCSSLKCTEKQAAFCRFCGVRVMYRDAHKKRCQSEDCVRLHKIEKGRATGDLEIDFMRSAWSREKKIQKRMARSEIEKRCQRAYWSAWMAKRYRKPATQKQTEEPKEITEKLIKSRIKDKRKWALMTPMKRKISYFVRETNSGRRHMANRKGSVKMRDMLEKLRQQGNRCALSGELIDHQNCEIDHIVPVSRGGSSDIENLQFVSKRMNRMKGTMTNEEFAEACKSVVEHTLPLPPTPPVSGPS
jgi:hypothetical protein